MKTSISLIVTVLNEELSVEGLLNAVVSQTYQPSEFVIVDGGSTDKTVEIVEKWCTKYKKLKISVLRKEGNRSIGRNFAISQTQHPLIAITDAGCVPHSQWLEKLVEKYHQTQAQVVAGYYDAHPKSSFEEAVVPYVLVMPDRVNPQTFLPATRSMLIEKKVWVLLDGFDEKLSDNEDYAFAKKLQSKKVKIAFARDAVVTWIPRSSLASFAHMIYRFARGDVRAGIIRPKVVFIFVRYILLILSSLILLMVSEWKLVLSYWFLGLGLYSIWSIYKNLKYVPHGWYWLPVLQIVSDIEIMRGTLEGYFQKNV